MRSIARACPDPEPEPSEGEREAIPYIILEIAEFTLSEAKWAQAPSQKRNMTEAIDD